MSDQSSPEKRSPTFISLHLPTIRKEEISGEEAKQQVPDGDLFENESVDSEAEEEESDSDWDVGNEPKPTNTRKETKQISKKTSSTSNAFGSQTKIPLILKSSSAKLNSPKIRAITN
jgi:hypothetical protein